MCRIRIEQYNSLHKKLAVVIVGPIYINGSNKRVKQFNLYMHLLTFKMPTIRQVWHFIQQGDHAFSICPKATYFCNPIVKYHHFLCFM